jgi:2'-5' RNA ligase
VREFVAIELPERAKHALHTLQGSLAAALVESGVAHAVRWTAVESIHLTLRFLGETSSAQQARVEAMLRATVPQGPPLRLTLRDVGLFPNVQRPSVVWSGVTGQVERLRAVQAATEATARSAGFEAEGREYSPHVTVGRFRREASPSDLRRAGAAIQAFALSPRAATWSVEVSVSQLVLMRSDLLPGGARYTRIATFPLAIDS